LFASLGVDKTPRAQATTLTSTVERKHKVVK
jgi:hypothetical protein